MREKVEAVVSVNLLVILPREQLRTGSPLVEQQQSTALMNGDRGIIEKRNGATVQGTGGCCGTDLLVCGYGRTRSVSFPWS